METLCPMVQCLFFCHYFLEVIYILVDAHTHLAHYKNNLATALQIINEKKIYTLACSMNKKDYLWLKELSKKEKYIIPCYGIHPWEVSPELEETGNKEEISHYIKESPIIGEIGLDFYWAEDKESYPLQLELLHFFFKKAKEYGKIVNLHTKAAEKEILDLLKDYQLKTPIIHWYSGPLELVDEFIALDCYWTISVDISGSSLTRALVERIPIDRILTETDGPSALEWVNGQYAFPDYVEKIIREIADIKNIDYDNCRRQINQNFKNMLADEIFEKE